MTPLPICECGAFWDQHHDECPVRREIERLRATISRLREYARHKSACPAPLQDFCKEPLPCDCGYDALLAALEDGKP